MACNLREILTGIVDVEKDISYSDIGSIPRAIKDAGKKTILFNVQPQGSDGRSGNFRVISNVCARREILDRKFGINMMSLLSAIDEHPGKGGDLQCDPKTCIKEISEIRNMVSVKPNLNLLPLTRYYPLDGGKYIASAVVIANDPEYGRNMSFHRMMVIDENHLAIRLVPRHTYTYYKRSIERGEDLKISVVIGLHPAFLIPAAVSVDIRRDEMEIAKSLIRGGESSENGESTENDKIQLIKSKNTGVEIPDAEIVLEGRITQDMTDEGPFVDLTGTYDQVRAQPVVEITEMFYKKNFIYHSLLPGGVEHKILMGMPREPVIYRRVNEVTQVSDVRLTDGGCGWLHGVVSINKRRDGDAKNAIMAAFTGHPSMKRIVIVDPDIDVGNPEQVEWAIACRFRADRDLVVIPGASGSTLDPASPDGTCAKVGIDATKPLKNKGEFDRARM